MSFERDKALEIVHRVSVDVGEFMGAHPGMPIPRRLQDKWTDMVVDKFKQPEDSPLPRSSGGAEARKLRGTQAVITKIREEPVLEFFLFHHLPEPLASVARPFMLLAFKIYEDQEPSLEKTKCLDNLLAARDAAIRAELTSQPLNKTYQ